MGNFDLESGKRFMQEGEFVEAIRCLLASLDQDPGDPEAYVELFRAYDAAWHESGDPLVLDQMRKVAVAGLKRRASPDQRRFLEEALDRADEAILAVQQAEEQAARDEAARSSASSDAEAGDAEVVEQPARSRRLPMFRDHS